jgi:LysM repeat protein
MKKTSTGLLAASACAAAVVGAFASHQALASDAASRLPVTTQQRSTAEQVAQAGVPLSDLAPSAPDRYTVKSGDTLWGLSSMYLTSPWRWPELWGMNKTQIANPHLIYPGQVLVLTKRDWRAMLGYASDDGGVEKLSPQARDLGTSSGPISAIPNHLIEPFLSQPLVLEANAFDNAPRIVATQEDRQYIGRGELAFARGLDAAPAQSYNVYRPLRPLFRADDTRRRNPIAYEAFYLGSAAVKVPRPDVSTLVVESVKQEMGTGDRLMPLTRQSIPTYAPSLPPAELRASVISIYNGVRFAGGGDIVTLDAGAEQGLQVGSVVELQRRGQTIRDRTAGGERVTLPDEQLGYAFVFRTFPQISYALIVRGQRGVEVGDRVTAPEASIEAIQAENQRRRR